ncbi:MAG: prolyl oligopeptidase family serine peptidase [Planctomycetota bacterium]|nr:prolyl oligopeptidase family serine peptidase [Planctomycetota bacterium]
MLRSLVALLALGCLVSFAQAQGTRADYERAAKLGSLRSGKVLNERIDARWLPEGAGLVHSEDRADGSRTWWLVDAEKASKVELLGAKANAELVAQSGSPLRIERVEPLGDGKFELRVGGKRWTFDRAVETLVAAEPKALQKLSDDFSRSRNGGAAVRLEFRNARSNPIEVLWIDSEGQRRSYGKVEPGGRHAQGTFAGHNWLVLDEQGRTLGAVRASEDVDRVELDDTLQPLEPRERRRERAPETPREIFARGRELVRRATDGSESVLATVPEGRNWSNDLDRSPAGAHFIAWEHAPGGDRVVHYVESSPRGSVHPVLRSYPYLKPGDPIPQRWPRLFESATGREIPLSRELFDNPWSIDRERWAPDGSRFTFVYNQRGHTVVRLVSLDALTGKATAVIDENGPTFFDYAAKLWLHHVEGSDEVLWMSERSGWNHLWRIDGRTGAVLGAVTSGEWVVKRVVHVDDARRELLLVVAGRHEGEDPYHEHFARVNFDGTGFVELTDADGTHELELSPDRRFALDRWSRVDHAPVVELRRLSDGAKLLELGRANTTALAATGWRAPERFVAKGRDGTTDIFGLVHWPSNFDPSRPHPIVEQIYAGPHDFHVPKEFHSHHGHASELAELGFVVVQIDGMGTNWRSKAFHDVAWKNLADSGFPDRIAWLRALAATHPGLDLTRVGIFGGSAGGQNALRALLDHGDFYRAAVADCGCHDNRVDKIWWNELWMSWPLGPHYEASSNVAHASRLQGDLLLIVGEADRNVDPASTMQVVDALVRADKDFDLLVIPGGGHGSGGSPYGWRRTMDFFVRKLLHVEPRQAD